MQWKNEMKNKMQGTAISLIQTACIYIQKGPVCRKQQLGSKMVMSYYWIQSNTIILTLTNGK